MLMTSLLKHMSDPICKQEGEAQSNAGWECYEVLQKFCLKWSESFNKYIIKVQYGFFFDTATRFLWYGHSAAPRARITKTRFVSKKNPYWTLIIYKYHTSSHTDHYITQGGLSFGGTLFNEE